MMTAEIKIPAATPHLCSVVTGFVMLEAQGKIRLSVSSSELPSDGILEVRLGGKTLAYDMSDGYNFKRPEAVSDYLKNCDCYFKRSFSDSLNEKFFPDSKEKIQKWGFNYLVTCKGNSYFNRRKNIMTAVNLLRGRKPLSYFTYDRFECEPDRKKDQKILFMTRLWTADQTTEKNLDAVNTMRVELCKALRREYGEHCLTGIYDGDYARKICPDLILPGSLTGRNGYLESMKGSDICIGSTGLHGSIGWKTGEYVAASRAIINEKFNYEVTGDFEIGKNYFDFDSVDGCMAHVEKLFSDPDLVYQIKVNNRNYYRNYLRPDVQAANSLKAAGVDI